MKFIKKSKIYLFINITFIFLMSIVFIRAKDIFAVVDYSGKPTTTFTSNATSSGVSNYIKQATGSTADLYANFNVPTNLRTSDNSKPLYLLMKNKSTPLTTEQFEIVDDNPTNITDKGILYILGHGYNSTNTTKTVFSDNTYGAVTDNNIKQYITQVALWLYIYEKKASFSETYCVDGGCDFTNNSSAMTSSEVRNTITTAGNVSGYNYLKYITTLVDQASSYAGGAASALASIDSSSIGININNDYSLLTTSTITPTATANATNYMYYSLEITDPNNYGAYITDTSGNRITNLAGPLTGAFKVAVPLKSDITTMDLTTVSVKVYGHFIVDEGYEYRVTNSPNELVNTDKTQKYSNVLLGYVPTEVKDVSFSLRNFTKISKIDVANSNELPGATLEITNTDTNRVVTTWVSTSVPHYLTLTPANYKLCETQQPEGYELHTECINFTVTANQIGVIVMPNQLIPIPDTGKSKSSLVIVLGILFLIVGAAFTTFVVLTKKNSAV